MDDRCEPVPTDVVHAGQRLTLPSLSHDARGDRHGGALVGVSTSTRMFATTPSKPTKRPNANSERGGHTAWAAECDTGETHDCADGQGRTRVCASVLGG